MTVLLNILLFIYLFFFSLWNGIGDVFIGMGRKNGTSTTQQKRSGQETDVELIEMLSHHFLKVESMFSHAS